jgi:tRNA threonylcarbamoyladenosine biosynthesis protein TsaE
MLLELFSWAKGYSIWTFEGTLGAGKTTLITHIANYLNAAGPFSSPTYTLIQTYPIANHEQFKGLTHMDWYRIESKEEGIQAGLEDALYNKQDLICIEWASKIKELLPKQHITIKLTVIDATTRLLTAEKQGF